MKFSKINAKLFQINDEGILFQSKSQNDQWKLSGPSNDIKFYTHKIRNFMKNLKLKEKFW